MNLGKEIATARDQDGLSLIAASRKVGHSVPTIRSVEAGSGTISSMLRQTCKLDRRIWWVGYPEGMALGPALAIARKGRRLSQRSLATLIGVTQPTIVAMERRSDGRMETLERYLSAVRVSAQVVQDKQEEIRPRQLIPKQNGPEQDRVFTPLALSKSVIDHFPLSGRVLDPCRGDGAFYSQLPGHVERHWCEIEEGRDFLDWQVPVSWIITNPPWSKFRDFLKHGMKIADNVVYLAAFSHFGTKARIRDMSDAGFAMKGILFVPTPAEWPQSGFQVAAVHIQRGWVGPCEIVHLGDGCHAKKGLKPLGDSVTTRPCHN